DPFATMGEPKAPTDPFGSLPAPVNPTLPFGQGAPGPQAPAAFSPFDDGDFHAAGPMGVDGDTRSQLFGSSLDAPGTPMSAASSGGGGLLDLPAPAQEFIPAPASPKVTLKLAPAPTQGPPQTPVPESAPMREGGGARGVLVSVGVGLVLLVLAGVVMLAVMNEGRLSPELWQRSVTAKGPLEARDVSN